MSVKNLLPLSVYHGPGDTIAILDCVGREVVMWSGFDGSPLNKTDRLALAKLLVRGANEASLLPHTRRME